MIWLYVGFPLGVAFSRQRTSCYCWVMYLRILKRYVEHGEMVPYERRLDV